MWEKVWTIEIGRGVWKKTTVICSTNIPCLPIDGFGECGRNETMLGWRDGIRIDIRDPRRSWLCMSLLSRRRDTFINRGFGVLKIVRLSRHRALLSRKNYIQWNFWNKYSICGFRFQYYEIIFIFRRNIKNVSKSSILTDWKDAKQRILWQTLVPSRQVFQSWLDQHIFRALVTVAWLIP